jgi:uncharacterized protein (TIGR03435 family)
MQRAAAALGLVGLLLLARPRPTLGQAPPELQFEAASVKAVPEGHVSLCGEQSVQIPCTNVTPRMVDPQRFRAVTQLTGPMGIIEWAYGVRDYQVLGAPGWLQRESFEILATTEHPASEGQLKQMVRALLVDRFKLKLHRETREMPLYALVVGKNGPKLSAAKNAVLGQGDIEIRPGRLAAFGATMDLLAHILTENLERPVIDKTDLDGHYDFSLTYEPVSTGAGFTPIGPSLFASIQDVGLRLEPLRDPVEMLVIDSVDHPSEN